jgi:hypothetical protein
MALSRITSDGVAANAITTLGVANGAIITVDLADTAVTGPKLATYAVSGNNIGLGAVSGNQIGTYAVSGNQISTGAISSNHFAGGGVTSDVLSSNLTISTVRLAETINVITGSLSGNYSLHLANSTVYHTIANSAGHVTFNMIANTTHSLNQMLRIGQSVSTSVLLKQGSTRWRANVHIDGVLQTAYWAGNTQPLFFSSASQAMTYDAYNFSIIKIADSQYTVFASNTLYGQANGQGMGVTVAPFGQGQ